MNLRRCRLGWCNVMRCYCTRYWCDGYKWRNLDRWEADERLGNIWSKTRDVSGSPEAWQSRAGCVVLMRTSRGGDSDGGWVQRVGGHINAITHWKKCVEALYKYRMSFEEPRHAIYDSRCINTASAHHCQPAVYAQEIEEQRTLGS